MPLVINGTTIEHVVVRSAAYNGELDKVYANNVLVFESTVYVAKPTISGAYTFDASEHSCTITGYDAAAMTKTGTETATAAGTYEVTFTPKNGYAWTDGTTAPVTLTWTIATRSVSVPVISNTAKTYNGGEQSPTIAGVEADYVEQTGDAAATDAGSYTVTWTLKYPASTKWSDDTTADRTGSWTIGKASVNIPGISGTIWFDYVQGAEHTVTVVGKDANWVTQSGDTTITDGTGPETKTITWSLVNTNNLQWTDGTIAAKSQQWGTVWTNGVSHYSNDLYNRGWYNDGTLTFVSGTLSWQSDHFVIAGPGGGASVITSGNQAAPFHVLIKTASVSSAYIVEVNAGNTQYSDSQEYSVSTSTWTEISKSHAGTRPRWGIRCGGTYYVQRIWLG